MGPSSLMAHSPYRKYGFPHLWFPILVPSSSGIDGNGSIYLGLDCSCLYRMAPQHEYLPDKLVHTKASTNRKVGMLP